MLYDSERVKWWKRRSESLEYQKAYENVAQAFGERRETLVDVACGNGAFLKKVLPYFNRAIATDNSEEMLKLARKKLNNSKKVSFVNDDIMNSKLSSGIADITTFLFPEVAYDITDGAGLAVRDKLRDLAEKLYGKKLEERLLTNFFRDYQLARITKNGGFVVITNYGFYIDKKTEKKGLALYTKQTNALSLDLRLAKFFESEAIFSDTKDSEETRLEFPNSCKGYYLYILQKFGRLDKNFYKEN